MVTRVHVAEQIIGILFDAFFAARCDSALANLFVKSYLRVEEGNMETANASQSRFERVIRNRKAGRRLVWSSWFCKDFMLEACV